MNEVVEKVVEKVGMTMKNLTKILELNVDTYLTHVPSIWHRNI